MKGADSYTIQLDLLSVLVREVREEGERGGRKLRHIARKLHLEGRSGRLWGRQGYGVHMRTCLKR